VRGKEITPFLLDYIHEHTEGTSVTINVEIVRGNCALAAKIACAWSELQSETQAAGESAGAPRPEARGGRGT
jgi:hypothetical protein